MLCAISALRKVLITADVSAFASFTSFARLGVTPARRSTTWASHRDEAEGMRRRVSLTIKKRIRRRLERVKATDEISDLKVGPKLKTVVLVEVGEDGEQQTKWVLLEL